jgi:hypothetical protein
MALLFSVLALSANTFAIDGASNDLLHSKGVGITFIPMTFTTQDGLYQMYHSYVARTNARQVLR